MSGSKHFDKIAWTVTAFILIVTILFMNGSALGMEVMAHTMGYETRLFDNTKVHTIDIVMNDWDEFIANATSEEYYAANVVIDGEAYKNVGIRGKGNTSLSTVSSLGSQRYSFKIEFDQYDSSITYHGLDKLSLNNLIQDSTMMKDYLTYTMMNEFGAAAPLCSFVYITVNGADWGLYLAVEGLEDSFLERNYGSDYGELYKPDSMSFGGGRGNGKDFNMHDFMSREEPSESSGQDAAMPDMENFDFSAMFGGDMPDMGSFDPSTMFGGNMPDMTQGGTDGSDRSSSGGAFDFGNMGGFGGFGMGSSDVKLQYIDDNIDSYSNIWNNAKTDITQADQVRLIESLEKLSNGEQIESVVDIEQVIRYFVVHNYVCNGDSYTGSMIHNYYLYEKNGQLAMLPWDYNLAYGTFQGGNGQSTVNTPIDAPVSGGAGEDRPMWSWILSDEHYTELYHQYFAEFLDTVDIAAIIENAYCLIKPYVEKDPTAFYTLEEFETGVETMRQFCALRCESISMQLANGETTSNMNYVDASALTLSNMGSMSGMGGFGGGMPGRNDQSSFGDRGSFGESDSLPKQNAAGTTTTGLTAQRTSIADITLANSAMPVMSGAFAPSQMQGGFSGGMPEGFDPSQMQGSFPGGMPEGFDPSQMHGSFPGGMPEGFDPSQMQEFFPGGSTAEPETPPSDDAQSSADDAQSSADDAQSSDNTASSGGSSRPSGGTMQIPGGSFNMSGMNASASGVSGWIWIAVSVLILGAGLVIAKLYK